MGKDVKAVIFALGGVMCDWPVELRQYAENLGLPGDFCVKAIIRGSPNNAFNQLERGELTAKQFFEKFPDMCKALAEELGLKLPADFNSKKVFDMIMHIKMKPEMMNAVAVLKDNGIKTAVVTNYFIDDRDDNAIGTGILTALTTYHFDHVIKSCQYGDRKPDASIFERALKKLGVEANETAHLGFQEPILKQTKAMGLNTILVRDTKVALKELQELVGLDLFQEAQPVAVDPNKVAHGYVTTKSGVRFHYVEVGTGPPVIFCHGFPESWYEWKRQLPAVAQAGFRAIALDMKGYGESSNPPEISEYAMETMLRDMAEFLDAMGIPQTCLVGHDWGGALVWFFALHYADRVSSVAGLCTPLLTADPELNPIVKLKIDPATFDYQMYFQKPGVAEAEIEANLEKFVKATIRPTKEMEEIGMKFSDVTKRGGVMVGISDDIKPSHLVSEEELKYRVEQMKKSGLRSMLNWYRNNDENMKFNSRAIGRKLYMPALMVTCGQDPVLKPIMSKFMEQSVVNLTRGHIEESGHWVCAERSKELNVILVDWLNKVHKGKNTPLL